MWMETEFLSPIRDEEMRMEKRIFLPEWKSRGLDETNFYPRIRPHLH